MIGHDPHAPDEVSADTGEALTTRLGDGTLAGAGLDLWWQEPAEAADSLLRHPKILLTPQVAWVSPNSVSRLRPAAAQRLVQILSKTSTE